MKLVGLMPVRNEDWVLGLSARVALQWCDHLIVLDHDSTDQSARIIDEIDPGANRTSILHERGGWEEMRHRQIMLNGARAEGATHIAMIDADEVLTANLVPQALSITRIRALVAELAPGQMLELPGYNLRGSLDRYHSNGIWGNRWFSCAFKDQPEAHWAGDKFHSRNPAGVNWRTWRPIKQGEGGILHLWGSSERRLRAKHSLYKCVERLRFPAKSAVEIDRMYNLWRSPNDSEVSYPAQKHWAEPWAYTRTPTEWWSGYDWKLLDIPEDRMCDGDNEPLWQEAEVCRLVQEHGEEKFVGLDLFGVA
jgi:hypothetical protein